MAENTEKQYLSYDLLSTANWYDDIEHTKDYIENELHNKLENNKSSSKKDYDIKYVMKDIIHLIKFRTYSGEILFKNILEKLHSNIDVIHKNEEFSTGDDRLLKNLNNILLDMYKIKNNISKGLLKSSSDHVKLHTDYITEQNLNSNISTGKIPNLIQYGVYPEFIGKDISKKSISEEEKNSVEFVTSGLFGWNYTTPQMRSFGSCSHLGAIIADILYKKMKKDEMFKEFFKKNEEMKNAELLYDKLMEHDSVLPDLCNQMMEENKLTNIRVNKTLKLNLLYTIHSCKRNIFYDSIKIKKGKNIKFLNYTKYKFVKDNNSKNLIKDNTSKTDKNIKTNMAEIINDIKLSIRLHKEDFQSTDNKSNSINTSFANQHEEIVYNYISEISNSNMMEIFSHAITIIYLELIIFCNNKNSNNPNNSNNSTNKHYLNNKFIGYTIPVIKNNDINKIKKTHDKLYKDYLNIIRKSLSTEAKKAMGGLSLINKNKLSLERFGNEQTYPGDISILEKVNRYIPDFFSDINKIEENLIKSLNNLSNKYWKKDINYWIKKITDIFEVNYNLFSNQRQFREIEIKQKFDSLDAELKKLYKKEIDIMNTYVEKIISHRNRMKNSQELDNQIIQEIKFLRYYASSHICSIKRQILIIYKIVEVLSKTNMVTTKIDQASQIKFSFGPKYDESSFILNIVNIKTSLEDWFRIEVSRIQNYSKHKNLSEMSKSLLQFDCNNIFVTRSKTINVSNIVDNKNTMNIIAKKLFWKIFISNIKTFDMKLGEKYPEYFNGLYIPVHEKKGSYIKYYLFDIMPLVLDGKYTSFYGNKTPPQWLTYKDELKMKNKSLFNFTKNNNNNNNKFKDNKIFVMISNTREDMKHKKKWNSISINFLNKLIDKTDKHSSGNIDKKMFLIRASIYTILSKIDSYDSKHLEIRTIGNKNSNYTADDDSKFLQFLIKNTDKFNNFIKNNKNNNNKKNNNSKKIKMISKELIKMYIHTSIKYLQNY